MKALQVKKNKSGISYALVTDGQLYSVYKLCENYSRHVKGGIEKTWRYVEKGLSLEDATKLFNRRSA